MAQYKCEIAPDVWAALKEKARRLGTTPEALIDVRVNECCNVVASEIQQERRNKIISTIVDLPAEKIDELERAVERIATEKRL